jgi:hypothetical protein
MTQGWRSSRGGDEEVAGAKAVKEKRGTRRMVQATEGAEGDNVSKMTGKSGDGPRTNSKGESHCFHCGGRAIIGRTNARS